MSLVAPVSTPPLIEGDRLSSEEFMRRWEAMPDLKHAELIEGIVYMPSPVSNNHEDCHSFLHGWLYLYAADTPGCHPGLEGTWLMSESDTPGPDLTLKIKPEYGGQSRFERRYSAGAPELIVEVAVSSSARDFGPKKRSYESAGVREYLIALPRRRKLTAFELTPTGFQPLEIGADGIFRSAFFPGLWLDTEALWEGDIPRINAKLRQGLATPEHAEFAARLEKRRR